MNESHLRASELRLGNYIIDQSYPERECRVFRLNCGIEYPITYSYNKAFEYTSQRAIGLSGVPITDEWLMNLGFKKMGKHDVFEIDNLRFVIGTGCLVYLIDEDDRNKYCVKAMQFIHEIQNTYFALTGKELIITKN